MKVSQVTHLVYRMKLWNIMSRHNRSIPSIAASHMTLPSKISSNNPQKKSEKEKIQD